MSRISDNIEEFIKQLIDDAEKHDIAIQRNILARQFDCSPSQINYVLSTRFGNNRGYVVESKRGGGGYIRIYRVFSTGNDYIARLSDDEIAESISKNAACRIVDNLFEEKYISERERDIIKRAVSDRALSKTDLEQRGILRASILRELILILLK